MRPTTSFFTAIREGTRGQRLRGLLLALTLLTACSAIVDTDADQCTSDADCQKKGASFAGLVCSPQKVCVASNTGAGSGGDSGAGGESGAGGDSGAAGAGGDSGAGGTAGAAGEAGAAGAAGGVSCTTSAQCVAQLGDFHICRKSDSQCVKLLSNECTRVEGDYKNDNAIFIGTVLPSQGSDASNGIPNENSAVLALREINGSGGLPPAKPGQPGRPLVTVSCSDNSDSNTAIVAAQHLVNDIKVPAILGAAFSGITIKMTTQVNIPAGVLTMSPSATSIAITGLADNNLVWRTSPSDAYQASALALLMSQYLEAKVRADAKLTESDKLKVMIFNKGDSYGSGLAGALQEKLVFNGKPALDNDNDPYYTPFDYGDPDDPQSKPTNYPGALNAANEQKPHLIFIFGTNESITEIFAKIEEAWTEPGYRPQYVFADGGFVPEVWTLAKELETKLGVSVYNRIIGAIPGTTNTNFKVFTSLYKSQFTDGSSPDVFGAAGSYDIMYLLSYAISSLGDQPITGSAIASGLARVVPPGTTVKPGTTQLSQAFGLLAGGQSIDYEGASGPLNFDANGEAASDIQFWCVPKGADGKAAPGVTSGSYYDAAKNEVASTTAIATKCGF